MNVQIPCFDEEVFFYHACVDVVIVTKLNNPKYQMGDFPILEFK